MVTKEELLQKFVAKDVIKNKMITVAGQMFNEYEKELDNSARIIKRYEDYIGDNKTRKDILDKICGDNVSEICSERDEVVERKSINGFIKFLNTIKRGMLGNK